MAKLGRYDPCHCGSGKQYEQCCREKAVTLPDAPLAHPPSAADFAPDVDRDQIDEAVERLTLDWVGTIHQRDGVPLERLGMARDILEKYLLDRSDELAASTTLLIPWAGPLEETLRRQRRPDPAGVAALLELLPTYVQYLVERGFIDDATGAHILPDLWYVRRAILDRLGEAYGGAEALQAAEQVDWPEPARMPPTPVPPDLAALLTKLRHAGADIDPELLDRIRAFGSTVIPALIDLATNNQLHFQAKDFAAKWTPSHAVRLLGEMQAQEAIEPLLPLFMTPGEYDFAQALEEAFGAIGPAALPAVVALFADRTQDKYLRARAGNAMTQIARHYPATREAVIELERSELDEGTDPELNAFIIGHLLDVRAAEALPSIKRAYAEDRVELMVLGDLEEIESRFFQPFIPAGGARPGPGRATQI